MRIEQEQCDGCGELVALAAAFQGWCVVSVRRMAREGGPVPHTDLSLCTRCTLKALNALQVNPARFGLPESP